jgi:hypothetical protein
MSGTFPTKPATDDEWRSKFLWLTSVEGWPNVFLLGAFAKYVTIYAQQVRALNLVAALTEGGVLSARSRVGVVGGGIAGMTAAAAAAVAGAAQVSVFEKEPSVMRLQRSCEKRFVHPHIYDWPAPVAMNRVADLPVMNWEANTAAHVIGQMERAWVAAQERVGGRLADPVRNVKKIELVPGGQSTPALIVDAVRHDFDVVLLAIGFGTEKAEFGYSYWNDEDLGATEHEMDRKRWLVSGIGDGALTDLMRLCIRDFQHAKVLAAVDESTRRKVGDSLKAAEANADAAARKEAFLDAAQEVDADLKRAISFREIGRVQLNDRSNELFHPHSSILNRLITAWLLENKQFEIVAGHLDRAQRRADGRAIDVIFKDGPRIEVDRLVERHGPKRPLDTQDWLRGVSSATSALAQIWRSARKDEDWTREPNYGDVFAVATTSRRLRVDFGAEIGCVVVTGRDEIRDPDLPSRVRRALGRLRDANGTERYGPGRPLSLTPEHLRVAEVLSSPALYERAIRALCSSEIAVFDLTGHQSAVMLLLGVRSAVRRGITVVVSQDERTLLPFNVVALNPVRTHSRDLVDDLAIALESGFAGLVGAGDRYLDLPAYDPVRALGEDHRIRRPETEILMLRWFDEQYGDKIGDQIVRSHLADTFKASNIITVLDSRSPQLVDQRLYAAIRRTRLCVVDWTGSRPNVFFETGVRLAVSDHQPIFVLCEKRPTKWASKKGNSPWPTAADPWIPQLEQLFGLTRFKPERPEPLETRFAAYKKDPVGSARGALLSPGRTYAVVSEAIDRAREPGGQTLESFLLGRANLLAGPHAVEEGEVPVLYGNVLKEQVRNAAVEHTLAAWYYYLGRHKLVEKMNKRELPRDDPRLQVLEDIASTLSARFRNASKDFVPFRAEVQTVSTQIREYRKGG